MNIILELKKKTGDGGGYFLKCIKLTNNVLEVQK